MSCLYSAFVEWLKYYSNCNETNAANVTNETETVLFIKSATTYFWKKTFTEDTRIITLISKRESVITLEIILNYNHFNTFVQALYFLTWQTLCLSEVNLNILVPMMSLSFADLYELRKPENVLIYLKARTKKTTTYSSIILFQIIKFLHLIG